MDFIERSFGIAPDNGSGGLELLLIAVVCAALGYAIRRHRRVSGSSRTPHAP
jgi:hypothetical protein